MFIRYSDIASPSAAPGQRPRRSYRRNLPHFQVPARPHFVTFRTSKSFVLPEDVRTAVLRHCLFDHGRRIAMHAAVVMPDHVHAIFTPLESESGAEFPLSEILGGIKGASAHSVNRMLQRKGHVWQDESFDHVLRHEESLLQKMEYVRENPVRRGLVSDPEDYPWLWVDAGDAQPGAAVPQQLR